MVYCTWYTNMYLEKKMLKKYHNCERFVFLVLFLIIHIFTFKNISVLNLLMFRKKGLGLTY